MLTPKASTCCADTWFKSPSAKLLRDLSAAKSSGNGNLCKTLLRMHMNVVRFSPDECRSMQGCRCKSSSPRSYLAAHAPYITSWWSQGRKWWTATSVFFLAPGSSPHESETNCYAVRRGPHVPQIASPASRCAYTSPPLVAMITNAQEFIGEEQARNRSFKPCQSFVVQCPHMNDSQSFNPPMHTLRVRRLATTLQLPSRGVRCLTQLHLYFGKLLPEATSYLSQRVSGQRPWSTLDRRFYSK